MICPRCGWRIKKEDISVSFVHHFKINERWPPYAITFVLRCNRCGELLKEVTKSGEEAVKLWKKLDAKMEAVA